VGAANVPNAVGASGCRFLRPRGRIHRSFPERGNAGLRFGGLIEIFNISAIQFEINDEAA
jgi:hypothetical protein